MKNRSKNIRAGRYIIVLALLGSIYSGCSKMDDTYKDFIKDGKIAYTGKADPVSVHPGRARLMLAWPTPSDPKATRAKLFWNNRQDSIEVPINRQLDTTKVVFNNWEEGSYVFEVYTFDSEGNSSLKVEIMAQVYGDQYEERLLSKPIDASAFANDTLRITWGASPDATVIGSEIKYEDTKGVSKTLFAPAGDVLTTIPEFKPQTFQYRTLYKPSPLALDTFYTGFFSEKIRGNLNKSGWTITASSEDVAGNRRAINLIDGNLTNLFVNNTSSGLNYPHWVVVNMGKIEEDVEGFYFYQRSLNPTRLLEIQVGNDGVTWRSLGDYELARTGPSAGEPVRLILAEPFTARYFRLVFKNDYGNSRNVNMHEAGVFR